MLRSLPQELIERARASVGTMPVPARHSSTVVVLRDAPDHGVEAYLLRRLRSLSFAPGMYVFPGGSVDVGDGTGQAAQFFVELWSIAMKHWLKDAKPGDVFPFSSELGPPRYAATLPDGREYSDRWEQGLVMTKLAQQAWEKAISR